MSHIDQAAGRFVTVLPRTRREDGQLRDWMSTSSPDFSEGIGAVGQEDVGVVQQREDSHSRRHISYRPR